MRPFRDPDSFTFLSRRIDSVTNEIKALDNEYVLKASEVELEDFLVVVQRDDDSFFWQHTLSTRNKL